MAQQTVLKNEALLITLCGEVKGVGFRRYIWRIAKTLNLKGYVENIPGKDCVNIYVEGDKSLIDEFVNRIIMNKVYRIDYVKMLEKMYTGMYNDFTIIKSLGEEDL